MLLWQKCFSDFDFQMDIVWTIRWSVKQTLTPLGFLNNFFLFWDTFGKRLLHYDSRLLIPKRSLQFLLGKSCRIWKFISDERYRVKIDLKKVGKISISDKLQFSLTYRFAAACPELLAGALFINVWGIYISHFCTLHVNRFVCYFLKFFCGQTCWITV